MLVSILACTSEDLINSNGELIDEAIKQDSKTLSGRHFLTPSGGMPCTDASEICDNSMLPKGSDPYHFFGPNTYHGVFYTTDPNKAVVVDLIYEYGLLGKPKIREFEVAAHGLRMKINVKHAYITDDGYVRIQYMGNYSYKYEALYGNLDEDYGGLEVNLDSLSIVFGGTINSSGIVEYHIFHNTISLNLEKKKVF